MCTASPTSEGIVAIFGIIAETLSYIYLSLHKFVVKCPMVTSVWIDIFWANTKKWALQCLKW